MTEDWESDPEFMRLSPEAKRIIMREQDPDFAALSPTAQSLVISRLKLKKQAEPKSVSRFLENIGTSGGRFLEDVAGAVRHPLDTMNALNKVIAGGVESGYSAMGGTPGPNEQYWKDLVDLYRRRYGGIENILNTAYEDPVGMAADVSTVAGGAGTAARLSGLPRVARVAGEVSKVTDPLRALGGAVSGMVKSPESMYQSALKPSLSAKNRPRIPEEVATGLREGIVVSPKGQQKLQTLIEGLNDAIDEQIVGNRSKNVDPIEVAKRVDDVSNEFAKQVTPKADLDAIEGVKNEFLSRHTLPGGTAPGPVNMATMQPTQVTVPPTSVPIPIQEAQAMKRGTMQRIKEQYGKVSGAAITAQKALVMGLKEEIVKLVPEIAELNARESKALRLEPMIEAAVARIANHQMFGIGTPIAAAGVHAATGSAKAAAGLGALRMALDTPRFKSWLAIQIYKAQKLNPSKYGIPSMATAGSRAQAYIDALTTGPAENENE